MQRRKDARNASAASGLPLSDSSRDVAPGISAARCLCQTKPAGRSGHFPAWHRLTGSRSQSPIPTVDGIVAPAFPPSRVLSSVPNSTPNSLMSPPKDRTPSLFRAGEAGAISPGLLGNIPVAPQTPADEEEFFPCPWRASMGRRWNPPGGLGPLTPSPTCAGAVPMGLRRAL